MIYTTANQTQSSQLALFDYDGLDAETRIVVQQRTSEIKSLMRRSAQHILDIGHKLIEVKARLGHGNFLTWVQTEFHWDRTTAHRFMSVAEKFGGYEMLQIATFAPSALYLLASPSTPDEARQEALERADFGTSDNIYWHYETLKRLATIQQVQTIASEVGYVQSLETLKTPFSPN